MVEKDKLREFIIRHFDESELRTLCFDFGVDYEALPGESTLDRARELVAYADRRNRLGELVLAVQARRPFFKLSNASCVVDRVPEGWQPTIPFPPVQRQPSGRTGPLEMDYRALVIYNLKQMEQSIADLRNLFLITLVLSVLAMAGVAAVITFLVLQ